MDKQFAVSAPSASRSSGFADRAAGPVDQVNDALRLARELADRSTYIVGRLCGYPPTPPVGGVLGEKPSNGLIYDLAENATETRQRIVAALDELSRLETTIGG